MDRPRPRRIELDTVVERLGAPSPVVAAKILPRLDEHCERFIARSPLVFLATSDTRGGVDCSPRGDHPGFVTVLDEGALVIPERPGNRLAQSLRNIAERPGVGLCFVLPGRPEVLRVNGRGYLTDEPDLLGSMAVSGRTPPVAITVEVDEAYIHCGRALLRAQAWDASSHAAADDVPSLSRMLVDAVAANRAELTPTVAAVDEDLDDTYANLY